MIIYLVLYKRFNWKSNILIILDIKVLSLKVTAPNVPLFIEDKSSTNCLSLERIFISTEVKALCRESFLLLTTAFIILCEPTAFTLSISSRTFIFSWLVFVYYGHHFFHCFYFLACSANFIWLQRV